MQTITVAPAEEHEAPACLALMPEARALPVELLIAREGANLVGAAAVAWRSWSEPGGFPVTLQVMPEARGRGVGRRLLAAAVELSRGEAAGLWALRPVRPDDPAALFMRACGFAQSRRRYDFQASTSDLLAEVAPLLDRMRARGRIPETARVVPLKAAPLADVSWLISSAFGGGPLRAFHDLGERSAGARKDLDRSFALMQDDRLVGVNLWRIEGDVGLVEANVVARAYRGGWANLMLLEAGLRDGLAQGLKGLRFHCDDNVRDTVNLARRSAAIETSCADLYYYAL